MEEVPLGSCFDCLHSHLAIPRNNIADRLPQHPSKSSNTIQQLAVQMLTKPCNKGSSTLTIFPYYACSQMELKQFQSLSCGNVLYITSMEKFCTFSNFHLHLCCSKPFQPTLLLGNPLLTDIQLFRGGERMKDTVQYP